jgi:hypothetical protein
MNTEFAKMTTANGYKTNIGTYYHEWKTWPIPHDRAYEATLMDLSDDISDHSTGATYIHYHKLSLEIRVGGVMTTATARDIIADINKCIGANLTWGGYVVRTLPGSDSMEVVQEEQKIVGATVRFSVEYRTKAWDHTSMQ